MNKELDREETNKHVLLVKASVNCLQPPLKNSFFNSSDNTLMKVVINVIDVNDNVPKFVSNVFTGGVTTAADFGARFMHVKVTME